MKTHELKLRTRYAEIDGMARVHNSRYLVYFEEARTDLVRVLGYPYAKLEQEGVIMPVSEAKLQFKRPLYYDEEMTVQVSIAFIKNYSIKFCYKILCEDGELACTGYTIHAALDRQTLEFTDVPERMREILEPYLVDESNS